MKRPASSLVRPAGSLSSERRGASAVEFALVSGFFLFTVIVTIQIGIYYMTQSALDAGVNATASVLRNDFASSVTPTLPTAAQLKSDVVSGSGALITNNSSLAVEIRELSLLSATNVPVSDGYLDYGVTNEPLALRAAANVTIFAPGFSSFTQVYSSAVVRNTSGSE
jgi:Flp pilus assembly protein TadG